MRPFYFCLLLSFVSTPLWAIEVVVNAGNYSLDHAPVSITLKSAPSRSVIVKSDDTAQEGQIEQLPNGKVRIWWLVDELQAGKLRHYSIEAGRAKQSKSFSWSPNPNESLDLLFGDTPLVRYMHRPYDKRDIESTKKPFHHVFDPTGSHLITKGVGGKFSHHRGVFIGYNKIYIGGDVVDIWHARNGEHSVHREIISESAGPVFGEHVVAIDWNDTKGNTFIKETRTLRVYQPGDNHFLVELWTELKSVRGRIKLAGDRQHAGVQFRAAQEVADHEHTTRYLRPKQWKNLDPQKTFNNENYVDLPWNAIQFTVNKKRFTVAYLTDPENPDGARFSERAYGRFGEFIPTEITEDRPLRLHYQWWVNAGDDVSRKTIETKYQALANPPAVKIIND